MCTSAVGVCEVLFRQTAPAQQGRNVCCCELRAHALQWSRHDSGRADSILIKFSSIVELQLLPLPSLLSPGFAIAEKLKLALCGSGKKGEDRDGVA